MGDEELARRIENECATGDCEVDHAKADDLMCAKLRVIGYEKSADAYARVGKWYA